MSIIIYDGYDLVADTQATSGERVLYEEKIGTLKVLSEADGRERVIGFGIVGEVSVGYAMLRALVVQGMLFFPVVSADIVLPPHFPDGPQAADWPQTVNESFATTLLVIAPNGAACLYERTPIAVPAAVPVVLGSGSEFAEGALEAGATTEAAVRIACRRSAYCGTPVQIINLCTPRPARGIRPEQEGGDVR